MKHISNQFSPCGVQHIYQRAVDKGVIFYTLEDRLVYYTISAVNARKHGVKVAAASIMFTHIHQSVQVENLDDLYSYLHDTDTAFSRLYNFRHSRRGRLFEKPPGRAQKLYSKDKRSNLIYVYNNHVEKKLCNKAVDERWSLLAYALSDHPFSERLDMKSASRTLQKAIRLVNRRIGKLKGLEYCDLDKILPNLDEREKEQFTDYVIFHYSWIDYSVAAQMFDGQEKMITAIDSTTGAEYAIKEEFSKHSDRAYLDLVDFARERGCLNSVYALTDADKADNMFEAMSTTAAAVHHLKKFFHYNGRSLFKNLF